MEGKKKRGGWRGSETGAGRPKGKNQKPKAFKIDLDLIPYLESKPNQNEHINTLLRSDFESSKVDKI